MKKIKQPFETKQHDLSGHASVDFAGKENFASFALRLTKYNHERFSPVALRMFFQKGKPVVTLYAVDKTKKAEKGKLPVKKFKLTMPIGEILSLVKRMDFTVSDGQYDISKIVVMNK